MSKEYGIGATLERLSERRQLRIWTDQTGGLGSGSSPTTTVEEMIAWAQEFPEIAAQNPRPLSATFFDYFTVASFDVPRQYASDVKTAKEVIARISRHQLTLADIGSDIDYVLLHQNQFQDLTPERILTLNASRRGNDSSIEDLFALARHCFQYYTECFVPDNVEMPQVDLPVRRSVVVSFPTFDPDMTYQIPVSNAGVYCLYPEYDST